ncbi:MAG: endonuclease/exonuclease/phosphatase family protein [Chloroflexi bacterium]|nr:endonuclease/exonuclease/phosphatase family protein [Chloroflexota bacterium]
MRLLVATFNLRNTTDRYEERKPLLAAGFAALAPDIIGLQEVMFVDDRQDDFLARQVPDRLYTSVDARSERYPGFGNAILCSVGEVQAHEELRLSRNRVAHRALVALPEGKMLWFVNTHLHHKPGEPEVRLEQADAICGWMAEAPAADATIIAGDFNTPPFEPAYARMTAAGYRSAYREANGEEPAVTWPSGIIAETMDTDGDPNCLDYLWLGGSARAVSARLAFNQHAPGDPTLYPSDHFAVVAEVEI